MLANFIELATIVSARLITANHSGNLKKYLCKLLLTIYVFTYQSVEYISS